MINVDTTLITGHDLRNDNISLLRAIGDDDTTTLHPQLLKLFNHYIITLTAINTDNSYTKDETMSGAGMAWAYVKFYKLYEGGIYRHPMYQAIKTAFFDKYLLKINPLLVALSFNSVAYLWFCTEEHDLVEKIIKRLLFLSSVWDQMAHAIPQSSIELPSKSGTQTVTSIWVKCVPSFDMLSNKKVQHQISKLLPDEVNMCIKDVFTAFNLFRRETNPYHSIPSNVDYTVFTRIRIECAKTIEELIEILKCIDTVSFDPNFIFRNLKWHCTHEELIAALPQSQRAYNNQNVWLLLCWLVSNNKLEINKYNKGIMINYKWNVSDLHIGPAMFDYLAYQNKESVLGFLNTIQYMKNRKFNNSTTKEMFGVLFKHYRRFDITLDAKKLKIKRGVLINFLSAGLGDIFCT